MSSSVPPEVAKAIADHLFAGRKIDAIKLYRENTGQGLKESKDFVDSLEAKLRASEPSQFTTPPAGRGCVGSIILCAAGIAIPLVVMLIVRR